jgi:hypothetical protein
MRGKQNIKISLGVLSVLTFYFKDELIDIGAVVALNGVSACILCITVI